MGRQKQGRIWIYLLQRSLLNKLLHKQRHICTKIKRSSSQTVSVKKRMRALKTKGKKWALGSGVEWEEKGEQKVEEMKYIYCLIIIIIIYNNNIIKYKANGWLFDYKAVSYLSLSLIGYGVRTKSRSVLSLIATRGCWQRLIRRSRHRKKFDGVIQTCVYFCRYQTVFNTTKPKPCHVPDVNYDIGRGIMVILCFLTYDFGYSGSCDHFARFEPWFHHHLHLNENLFNSSWVQLLHVIMWYQLQSLWYDGVRWCQFTSEVNQFNWRLSNVGVYCVDNAVECILCTHFEYFLI